LVARDRSPLNLGAVSLTTQKIYHSKMMDVNCLVLTLEYFRADIRETYKILVWPAVVIFISAFLVLLFLRII
jgi:hypothetical protein